MRAQCLFPLCAFIRFRSFKFFGRKRGALFYDSMREQHVQKKEYEKVKGGKVKRMRKNTGNA